jgi:hypothetical protein
MKAGTGRFGRLICAANLAAIATLIGVGNPAHAGSIFITGHDPVWHAGVGGGNVPGAIKLAQTGINYARNGSALPFLFIESTTVAVPAGNAHEAPFLTSVLGYGGQYTVMNAAQLAALPDFRTALNSYSAIVVASDHGGMLTGAELSFLNSRANDIIDYLNAGGGLMASAESNAKGLLGVEQPFGFLPFLVASTSFQAAETSNTVTAFGASLGLVNADVNGNFSHNYFAATGGMTPVDLFNGDASKPLTLAYRGTITRGGVDGVPDAGATIGMFGLALGLLGFVARRLRGSV